MWRSGWPACVRSCGTGPTDLNRFDGCLSQSPAVVSVRSAFRPFGIGLVQTAVKLVVEPIFEADFEPNTYGYRPRRSAAGAIKEVHELLCQGYTDVVDADLSKYFDTIPHAELMQSVARRVVDRDILGLIKMWLKAPVEERDGNGRRRVSGGKGSRCGTPQGGVMAPRTQKITFVYAAGRGTIAIV